MKRVIVLFTLCVTLASAAGFSAYMHIPSFANPGYHPPGTSPYFILPFSTFLTFFHVIILLTIIIVVSNVCSGSVRGRSSNNNVSVRIDHCHCQFRLLWHSFWFLWVWKKKKKKSKGKRGREEDRGRKKGIKREKESNNSTADH